MKKKNHPGGQLGNYMYWPMILTVLIVVLDVPLYYIDKKAGFCVSIFGLLYFLIVTALFFANKSVVRNEVINFATQYGIVQKKLLNEFEVPYALLDYNSKILWMNEAFSTVTEKDKKYHKSIATIFPSVTRELLEKNDGKSDIQVEWKERFYRVKVGKIYFDESEEENGLLNLEGDGQFLMSLYLFDETELHQYIQANQDQQLVSAWIYIDNYEEALDSIEEVKRSLLVALVDRKVSKYFSERDSIIKKIEKDKYYVVFKYKYLRELEKDKFSILEEVKTIKVGNEMAVTLSIGLGVSGATYSQKYEHSRMAIDLALGRGGDQVVVKDGEKVSYFGGKSRQVEKMTRVKARVKAHALREIFETREEVFIMGHSISDMDAFGSSIGIFCMARVMGKKAHIVLDTVTSSLRPMKECFTEEKGYPADLFVSGEEALELVEHGSVVVVVDTNRPNYTECPELLKQTKTIVVFDHHRQGSEVIEGAVLSYIETYASSTCEMVAEVLQYFNENIHLKSNEADSIYAGILIDTNNFMTKTGVRTFEAAAYLRRCGAEVTRVRKLLRDDMAAYKARAEAVRHAEVYRGAFAISVCPADSRVESPTIAGAQAANELLNIVGIKASFVLTEYNEKIYISSRSIDEINVQLIMERMGGGGHLNVAGAQMADCSVNEAKWRIQHTLDQMLEEGDIEV
ncbi:MAG: DHH family phosphoesterase [Lachnospiraceae bacterium]|jgi:c-di-AMP phosphodiesterase-like protein|nr:DHH family phosphoesterase [Lachnospiraceae bacterium]